MRNRFKFDLTECLVFFNLIVESQDRSSLREFDESPFLCLARPAHPIELALAIVESVASVVASVTFSVAVAMLLNAAVGTQLLLREVAVAVLELCVYIEVSAAIASFIFFAFTRCKGTCFILRQAIRCGIVFSTCAGWCIKFGCQTGSDIAFAVAGVLMVLIVKVVALIDEPESVESRNEADWVFGRSLPGSQSVFREGLRVIYWHSSIALSWMFVSAVVVAVCIVAKTSAASVFFIAMAGTLLVLANWKGMVNLLISMSWLSRQALSRPLLLSDDRSILTTWARRRLFRAHLNELIACRVKGVGIATDQLAPFAGDPDVLFACRHVISRRRNPAEGAFVFELVCDVQFRTAIPAHFDRLIDRKDSLLQVARPFLRNDIRGFDVAIQFARLHDEVELLRQLIAEAGSDEARAVLAIYCDHWDRWIEEWNDAPGVQQ